MAYREPRGAFRLGVDVSGQYIIGSVVGARVPIDMPNATALGIYEAYIKLAQSGFNVARLPPVEGELGGKLVGMVIDLHHPGDTKKSGVWAQNLGLAATVSFTAIMAWAMGVEGFDVHIEAELDAAGDVIELREVCG